jgi:hypothetical protein
MGGNFQVVWGWLVFVNASSHVKSRTMAGTKKSTLPIVWQRWLRPHLEFIAGRASQMGANTHTDKKLWFDGSGLVSGVFWGEFRRLSLGLWVSQL